MSGRNANPPGVYWIVILGAACFVAGFFLVPALLIPESNLGPIYGFLSGPVGVAAGAVLWGACALLKPAPRTQWRMLYSLAALGVLATLLSVRPDPRVRGYVFAGEITSCASYLVGAPMRGYQRSEEVRPPDAWPPRDLLEVLGASRLEAVPDRWRNL